MNEQMIEKTDATLSRLVEVSDEALEAVGVRVQAGPSFILTPHGCTY
jgi:hypothetical protein